MALHRPGVALDADRDDSPWYPTMRLFRQDKAGRMGQCVCRDPGGRREDGRREDGRREADETGAETPGARGTRSPGSRPGQEAQTPAVVPDPTRYGDSRLLLDQGHVRVKHCRYGPMAYLATDQYIGQSWTGTASSPKARSNSSGRSSGRVGPWWRSAAIQAPIRCFWRRRQGRWGACWRSSRGG